MYTGGGRMVLMYKSNGKFVAIDMNSGGYPYGVDYPWQGIVWDSRKKAEDYSNMFPNEFELCYMQVEITKVDND